MNDHRPDRRRLARQLAGSSLALLAGCSGTLLPKPQPAPARFTLDDGRPAGPQPEPADTAPTLVVTLPHAAPGFGSPRMVYLRRAQELEAYAFHQWVEAPAQMLAPLLVRALQATGAFRAVLLAPSVARADWRLETELIRLQQDFGSQPSRVRLTLRAVLLDSVTRRAVAWREFDASVAAPSDDAPGGVAAGRQATERVLAALAAFCADRAGR